MSRLQAFIDSKRDQQELLLMTHVVYGYPNIETSLSIMRALLKEGVEILEVQFPFSDPVADGPVITAACHSALDESSGSRPNFGTYLKDINQLAADFPNSKILIMSYLNPLLQFGINEIPDKAKNLVGAIIPDLPIEQSNMVSPLARADICPIWLTIPGMSQSRLKTTVENAQGMLYCVSRKGVTGQTSPLNDLDDYLESVRSLTQVPLGVGFGISSPGDIQRLRGKSDVAIVGSALLNAYNEGGLDKLVKDYSLLAQAAR